MSVYQINVHNGDISCNLTTRNVTLKELKDICNYLVEDNLLDAINNKIRVGDVFLFGPTFKSGNVVILKSDHETFEVRTHKNELLASGNLYYFTTKVANIFQENKFLKYVDKVISFRYNGGTTPKKKRIVKVESVDDTHLRGKDVEQDESRNYFLTKIEESTLTVLSE